MNIFYLDSSPKVAAKYHCDKHVVKMIVESAQILSTVKHQLGESESAPYRKTHQHHPCVKWAASSKKHYLWLHSLFVELCKEYTHRYGKIHKTSQYVDVLRQVPKAIEKTVDWVEPPQAMAFPECKVPGDSVAAYRNYYKFHKAHFAKWKTGDVPEFMLEN